MKMPLSPAELLRATEILDAHTAPEADDVEEGDDRWYCARLFASDLHLGIPAFKSKAFMELLRGVRSDQLIIAGDFIDLLMLQKHKYFPQDHLTVIQKILRRARKGLEIFYIPGNHDKRMRKLAAEALRDGDILRLGDNIVVEQLHIFETKNAEKYLVLHGDEFDRESAFSEFWEKLGSHGYDVVMWLDEHINKFLKRLGFKEIQFSAWCKSWVKGLIRDYFQNFNEAVASVGRNYGVDGIVYGHVHTPGDKYINGVRVINLGAWVENAPAGCTALIEDVDGVLKLVQWRNGTLCDFATGEEIPKGEIRFATRSEPDK